jgi:TonB family protein
MWHRSPTRLLCFFLCVSASAFAQPPQRIRFAKLLSWADPVYPVVAKLNGIRGTVRLDVVIGNDGRVLNVESISGNPVLADAAKHAVMQWVYTPTLLNGEPIEVVMEVHVPFPRPQSKQAPPASAPPGPVR